MSEDVKDGIAVTVVVLVVIAVIIAGIFGIITFAKAYGRSQARADAKNRVQITHIEIQKADEEAQINHAQIKAQEAEAQKRIVEAHGIAAAQDIIQKTLTPEYIQFEAIKAQERIATSGSNNTVIYVPSGTNGTPLITANAAKGK
jgi:regulator of protease activity HflC (stomatin/prohibitin superfamily)